MHRILILNIIVVPGILFMTSVFEPHGWVLKQLDHLYKHILEKPSSKIERGRHKIAPDLFCTCRELHSSLSQRKTLGYKPLSSKEVD